MATADRPEGPYGPPSRPMTGEGVEGPSVLRQGREWLVYFDHYAKPQHYGAMKTGDFKSWEDITRQVSFPSDTRHGTALPVTAEVLKRLSAL